MNFTFLDIIFLIVFGIFLSVFLYSRRKKLEREGFLFLYRTRWGIKLIDYVGTKYKKTLHILSYVSVALGYILMGTMIYLAGKIVYIYVMYPQVVRAIKVPPIIPLVPYLPQVFKLDFLPPFYFTYWIVIIAIIAITHEFSHGIFARHFGVEIKSTGFGFLGPFLAAFVEPDEKKMVKKNKFSQLTVLSAGTFANVITAIVFLFIIIIFFYFSFVPAGVVFDTYAYSPVMINEITYINGNHVSNISYDQLVEIMNETKINNIKTSEKNYLATRSMIEQQEGDIIIMYDDAPAIRSNLSGAIQKINGIEIDSIDKLREEIQKYSPGEKIKITAKTDDEIMDYEIILEENPDGEGAWMGVGFSDTSQTGVFGKIYNKLSFFKEEHVYYEPKNDIIIFFYNLFWWIILISISVALVNMLPVGIFDGGRVFYLTVLFFLKSESKAKKIFSFVTYFFLIVLLLLMVFWFISFI